MEINWHGFVCHSHSCGQLMSHDPVNHPKHYTSSDIETIDVIQNGLITEMFKGYCLGQIYKYISRAEMKGNALQDYQKAEWYLKKLIKVIE